MMSSDNPEISLNFVSPGTGEKSVVTIPSGATPADMIKLLFEVKDIYAELEIPDHTLTVLSPELVVPICSGYAVLHRTNLTLDFLDEEEVPIQRSELTQTQANIASGLLVNANNAIPVIDIMCRNDQHNSYGEQQVFVRQKKLFRYKKNKTNRKQCNRQNRPVMFKISMKK